MLLSFSVSNYRSIRDKVTLSLLPVKSYKELSNNVVDVGDKAKCLRSAVIYGANASGKSNVLNALTGFIELIQSSSDHKLNDKIKLYDPFLLDNKSGKLPSTFELEFLIKEVRYVYAIACDADCIQTEKLFYYPKGQKVRVFERTETNKFRYGTVLKGEKKSIENRLLDNQLYLSKAANEKIEKLINIYSYFSNFNSAYAILIYFSEQFSPASIIGSALKTEGELIFGRFERIITALDVGIHSLKIKKNTRGSKLMGLLTDKEMEGVNFELKDAPNLESELVTLHEIHDPITKKSKFIEFSLEQESSGTRNLFMLALFLLDHFRKGTPMIIDEFEKSLHPHIVEKLIRLFHDPEVNVKNAQLIFSTHASSLLSNELFRRDQIWFTEKDKNGATELFSLSQVEGVRKDVPYDKWYLSGRFGATPILYEPDLNFEDDLQKGE